MTESVPDVPAAPQPQLADLPPDAQKTLLSTQRVFQWLSEMPPLDTVGATMAAVIVATNKLDGFQTSERDKELIGGWVNDLLSFLSCSQLFARGHLRAIAAKDDAGDEMLQFTMTTLGEKYVKAQEESAAPTTEEPADVGTDTAASA